VGLRLGNAHIGHLSLRGNLPIGDVSSALEVAPPSRRGCLGIARQCRTWSRSRRRALAGRTTTAGCRRLGRSDVVGCGVEYSSSSSGGGAWSPGPGDGERSREHRQQSGGGLLGLMSRPPLCFDLLGQFFVLGYQIQIQLLENFWAGYILQIQTRRQALLARPAWGNLIDRTSCVKCWC